ncbi:MAG: GPO family capsid scaffolding protein [Aeromonas sp.]
MAKKATFKRVAVAGQTTDGRTIAPEWLTQAAKNYSPNKYGARVNLEHYLSAFPDSDFRAYGDVLSLRTEEIDIDGVKKVALFAEIDPTDDLVKLTNSRNKVYTSIELDLDFAGTGEAYLVGLAVTNTPASLGTEYLKFCAGAGDSSPLAARKQKATNIFTCAIESDVELTEEADKGPSLLERVTSLFSTHKKQAAADFSDVHQAVEAVAKEVTDFCADSQRKFADQTTAITELTSKLADAKQELEALKVSLSTQEALTYKRQPATGGTGLTTVSTDC